MNLNINRSMTIICKNAGFQRNKNLAFQLQILLTTNHLCQLNIEEIQPLITTNHYIQIAFSKEAGQELLINNLDKEEELL